MSIFYYISVIFWSITYILLIIYMTKYKTIGIPVIAMLGNFAWELNALFHYNLDISILWQGGTIWAFFDFFVIYAYLKNCIYGNRLKRIFFFLVLQLLYFCMMYIVFELGYGFPADFLIDFIMAAAFLLYLIENKIIPNNLAVAIGGAKFLGDLAAWVCGWCPESFNEYTMFLIGLCSTTYDMIYLAFLIRQNREYRQKAP